MKARLRPEGNKIFIEYKKWWNFRWRLAFTVHAADFSSYQAALGKANRLAIDLVNPNYIEEEINAQNKR